MFQQINNGATDQTNNLTDKNLHPLMNRSRGKSTDPKLDQMIILKLDHHVPRSKGQILYKNNLDQQIKSYIKMIYISNFGSTGQQIKGQDKDKKIILEKEIKS